MPVALLIAAQPHLRDLWLALEKSGIRVVASEFERSLALAVEYQPDIVLVASPPIEDAVKTCERLLETPLTTNIPIFLTSLDGDSSVPHTVPAQEASANRPDRQITQVNRPHLVADDEQYRNDCDRRRALRAILEMLHYAETEISKLNLETSTALLGATIAEVAQELK
ncbi:hypothetical protein KUL72_30510 [Bradyrhizobium arachidis]|uniref:hypothetical protein n=1 Tax=Bradyrhizobium arachidis TaxID=858423 RepID=UPI002163398C|nr:hypothetical protein [Bradyrhizobium arachidis]UVO35693.1 hypothetical protein KUL72_30510 [Bradyrhizobium arachidis]